MTEDIHSRLVRHAGAVCISTAVEREASERIKELEAALSSAQADREALAEKVRRIGRAARRQSVNEAASADYFRGSMQSIADSCGDAIGEFIDIPATTSQLLSDGLRSEAEGKAMP